MLANGFEVGDIDNESIEQIAGRIVKLMQKQPELPIEQITELILGVCEKMASEWNDDTFDKLDEVLCVTTLGQRRLEKVVKMPAPIFDKDAFVHSQHPIAKAFMAFPCGRARVKEFATIYQKIAIQENMIGHIVQVCKDLAPLVGGSLLEIHKHMAIIDSKLEHISDVDKEVVVGSVRTVGL